jgi:hypothetical protein
MRVRPLRAGHRPTCEQLANEANAEAPPRGPLHLGSDDVQFHPEKCYSICRCILNFYRVRRV